MEQNEIKQKADELWKKLKQHRKQSVREERLILDEIHDIIEECSHPNLQGKNEGYCPDCGYTYG